MDEELLRLLDEADRLIEHATPFMNNEWNTAADIWRSRYTEFTNLPPVENLGDDFSLQAEHTQKVLGDT